jgi:hypothetical protein
MRARESAIRFPAKDGKNTRNDSRGAGHCPIELISGSMADEDRRISKPTTALQIFPAQLGEAIRAE